MKDKFVIEGFCTEASHDFAAGAFNKSPRVCGTITTEPEGLCKPTARLSFLPNFALAPGQRYRVTIEPIEG